MSLAPMAVIVKVVVEESRLAEFHEVIKVDVEGTRKEAGCLRFDFLKVQDEPNTFIFYECYRDKAANEFHKEQPHYLAYAAFRDSGGITSRMATITEALSFQSS
mmetsp:Transcript_38665/g.123942  ORF Transcript_38665/g.123942 Transcript_38665/m.123942 type:complete len:104 (-) Transcript_38665:147-458(-)